MNALPRNMLLWVDTESTGLLDDPIRPTILECAWTITDGRGEQLTPLRSTFTAFNTLGSSTKLTTPHLTTPHPIESGGEPLTDPVGEFEIDPDQPESQHYPDEDVRRMHQASGLATDWAWADKYTPERILRSAVELDRLILDDLLLVQAYDMPPRTLWLAGPGSGHYERDFLPHVTPRVMDSRRWPWHYRPADISVELSNSRLREAVTTSVTLDELIDGHRGDVSYPTWSKISTDTEHRPVPDDTFSLRHRAATDVATGLIGWRIQVAHGR